MNALKSATLLRQLMLSIMLAMVTLSANAAEVVDINRADAAAMIENWKGIGEVKAKAIVAYRKKNGPFASINDLLNVKGIGETLIKKNKKLMSVKGGIAKAKKATASASSKSTKKNTSKPAKTKKDTKKKDTGKKKDSTKKSSTSKSTKKKPVKKKAGKKKPVKKKSTSKKSSS